MSTGNISLDILLNKIIEDGEVTPDELAEFTQFCNEAFNPVENSNSDSFDGEIAGKNIVLTGDFELAPRKQVEKMLTEQGANVQSGVTAATNLVIVGKRKSKAWSMGNYGSKIERAKQLQSAGYAIQIIQEEDVFK